MFLHGNHLMVDKEQIKSSPQQLSPPKKGHQKKLSQSLGYQSIINTKNYHIINGRGSEKHTLAVVPNSISYGNYKFKTNSFQKIHIGMKIPNRPNYEGVLNEHRFESFNQNPPIYTKSQRAPNFKFSR